MIRGPKVPPKPDHAKLTSPKIDEYDRATRAIVSLKINGKEVLDDVLYTVIMQKFHYMNIEKYLDLTLEEIERNGKAVMAASNSTNVLEEYFVANPLVRLGETPRIIIH